MIIVKQNKEDIVNFSRVAEIKIIDDLLESLNLSFGTDISKYKLDKE